MTFDIECPVCFEEDYNKYPATLKCGHTICSQCLVSHTIKSCELKKNVIECPLCRSTIVEVDEEIEFLTERKIGALNKTILLLIGLVALFIIPYYALHLIIYLCNELQ